MIAFAIGFVFCCDLSIQTNNDAKIWQHFEISERDFDLGNVAGRNFDFHKKKRFININIGINININVHRTLSDVIKIEITLSNIKHNACDESQMTTSFKTKQMKFSMSVRLIYETVCNFSKL